MEPTLLSIRSTSSRRELVFSHHRDEYFHVELKGFELSAATDIWAYTDANGLNQFFQELAEFKKPWQGQHSWASIEQDFHLSAICTSLGSVAFQVELRGLQGAPEEWCVEAGLVSEFGQLEQIAKNAEAFFNACT
ncbi:DUF6228 family protein [Vogesella indigofera]|uniref:DUF6228 family protein n=1 Tax=Vogesella indigofera TaxID=45465 RepID=UPI0011C3ACEC|nr:DUF6228 family protein [Vogesella indigofera]